MAPAVTRVPVKQPVECDARSTGHESSVRAHGCRQPLQGRGMVAGRAESSIYIKIRKPSPRLKVRPTPTRDPLSLPFRLPLPRTAEATPSELRLWWQYYGSPRERATVSFLEPRSKEGTSRLPVLSLSFSLSIVLRLCARFSFQ